MRRLVVSLSMLFVFSQAAFAKDMEVGVKKRNAKTAEVKVAGVSRSVTLKAGKKKNHYLGSLGKLKFDVTLDDAETATVAVSAGFKFLNSFQSEVKDRDVRGKRIYTWAFDDGIDIGPSFAKMSMMRSGAKSTPRISLQIREPVYLTGEVKIGDVTWHLAIADYDLDGLFGTKGDSWTLTSDDALAARSKGFNQNSMIEAFEPIYLPKGEAVTIGKVARKTVTLRFDKAKDTVSDYFARREKRVFARWTKRFETSLAGLIAGKAEAGRKKTKQPIKWMYDVDVDNAIAKAKKEGKLVLVDFSTDWCSWCKVLDYLTFTDSEVAKYVRDHFVAVKINAEFVDKSLPESYDVSGFPSLPILDGDGKHLTTLVGFKPPSKFLDALKKAKTGDEDE